MRRAESFQRGSPIGPAVHDFNDSSSKHDDTLWVDRTIEST